MRVHVLLFLILTPFYICSAQEDKGNRDKNSQTLSIEKKTPLYIRAIPLLNKCEIDDILFSLRDSLEKEGFNVVDSAKAMALQISFMKDDLMNPNNRKKNESHEEFIARIERTTRTKRILQEINIQNNSCLDTLHNYTIRIYLFPRPRAEEKVLSFTLPFSSPYRISDIILSLIERELPKK